MTKTQRIDFERAVQAQQLKLARLIELERGDTSWFKPPASVTAVDAETERVWSRNRR